MTTAIPLPWRANVALGAVFLLLNLGLWAAVPLWLLPLSDAWAWLLVPVVLATNSFWAYLHEAIHGLLFPSRRINDAVARLLAVLFGAPFRVLRFGHLMHHRFNRTEHEVLEVACGSDRVPVGFALKYYFHIFGGLYLIEVASAFICLLPRPAVARFLAFVFGPADGPGMGRHAPGALLTDRALAEMRFDGLAVVALLAGGLAAYGGDWPYLLAALAGRGFLVSFLDNVYHYATPMGDRSFALNPTLPGPLGPLLLNFNLHGVHHVRPGVPWSGLPAAARADGAALGPSYFLQAVRQLKGPVADPAAVVADGVAARS